MIYKSKIPIYYGELHIIIADDFTKHGNFKECVNEYPAFSTPIDKDNWIYGIFINPKRIDDHSLIAHEALHIVGYIFASIKAKMDVDNDEPQCYLLGWVVDEVYKAIKKYKKNIIQI